MGYGKYEDMMTGRKLFKGGNYMRKYDIQSWHSEGCTNILILNENTKAASFRRITLTAAHLGSFLNFALQAS